MNEWPVYIWIFRVAKQVPVYIFCAYADVVVTKCMQN